MIVLLPCYSLEDFSLYRSSEESDEIFSAWSALYHPALIEKMNKIPRWEPAGNPMSGRSYSLILIPPCCESKIPASWLKEVEASEAILVRGKSSRSEMIADALKQLGIDNSSFDSETVESFLSLGFCHLLTELLTRKLRYMSNLDAQNFENRIFDAVKAAQQKRSDAVADGLQNAFDLLCQSKEYFFPTAVKFLDLTWIEEDDLAENLPAMIQRRQKRQEITNLVLPEPLLETLQKNHPQTLDLLKEEINADRVHLIGSDAGESPLYLLSATEMAEKIKKGRQHYFDFFNIYPTVFGRQSAGYSPILPQILRQCGYRGALAWTNDGWSLNGERQSLIFWKTPDGSCFPTLSKQPIDAESGENFMLLPDSLGNTYYSDKNISAIFAHRPNKESIWLGDIFRMNRFAPVLGQIYSIEKYFEIAGKTGLKKEFEKDDFRTNFLTRASKNNIADSVSVWQKNHWKNFVQQNDKGIEIVSSLILKKDKFISSQISSSIVSNILKEAFEQTFLYALGNDCSNSTTPFPIEPQNNFRSFPVEKTFEAKNKDSEIGYLIVNPSLSEESIILDERFGEISQEHSHLISVSIREEKNYRLLKLPAMSRIWIPQRLPNSLNEETLLQKNENKSNFLKRPREEQLPIAKTSFFRKLKSKWLGNEDNSDSKTPSMADYFEERFSKTEIDQYYRLCNEFFEVRIDPITGEMRRLTTFSQPVMRGDALANGLLRQPSRGNRFAFQLCLKLSDEQRISDQRSKEDANFGYSIMSADQIEILSTGPFFGRIQIQGRLMAPDGEMLSRFTQILTIQRASRIIDVWLKFDPVKLPTKHYWDNYLGCRFAWKDSSADVLVGNHHSLWTTSRDYLQAPHCVDIRSDKFYGITILSAGLPFYRRFGLHRLDSVLIPANESQRIFRFGIGVDLANPIQVAQLYGNDSIIVLDNCPKLKWTFEQFIKVEVPNIIPLSIEPVYENKSNIGSLLGIRVVFQETENKKTVSTLKLSVPVKKVNIVNMENIVLDEICLKNHQAFDLSLNPKQILKIEICFK
ncbi:MAG: hypothetical protein Q4C95_02590 [Planctomycetia bacterium]|nr:hypothetical protein [Planctomycetia bacterium]